MAHTPGLILAKQKLKKKKSQFSAEQVTKAAQELGSMGGIARDQSLSQQRRSEIARLAANVRWGIATTGKGRMLSATKK